MRVENGTKVLVHSKSTGCPLEIIFNRRRDKTSPKDNPFFAWVNCYEGNQIYALVYERGGVGGDYYRRSDFELTGNYFKDEDFEL